MFYKHWKKIALALTGFFWASCDSDTTSANGSEEPSSSSVATPESSSSIATGNETTSSSSEATEASSSSVEKTSSSSSNDFEKMVPLYGIEMDKTICTQVKGESTMQCDDGVTCTQRTEERWAPEFPCSDEICPDYGVVQISENTYECDGVKYNEAQFRARYGKITVVEEPQDTIFKQEPVLYGPPCVFNGTCDDAEK